MSKLNLLKRIVVAISLFWIICAIIFAKIQTNYDIYNKFNMANGICYNHAYQTIFHWLIYSMPSFILILFVWCTSGGLIKAHLVSIKAIRFSIAWIVIAVLLAISDIFSNYAIYNCVTNARFELIVNDTNALEIFISSFLWLQVPLFLYWLVRWVIKGNNLIKFQ